MHKYIHKKMQFFSPPDEAKVHSFLIVSSLNFHDTDQRIKSF